MKLYIGRLSVVSGNEKRFLETYLNPALFRQRKSYDEYYIDVSEVEVNLSLSELMKLSEWFDVTVHSDHVSLHTVGSN